MSIDLSHALHECGLKRGLKRSVNCSLKRVIQRALTAATAVGVLWSWSACTVSAASAVANASDVWVHLIEPGDTLIGLRDRYLRPDADWRALQRINRIQDPRRLRVGSSLTIPLSLMRSEAVSAEVLHRHGDVWLERAGGARQPLAAAAVLYSNDVVGTGPLSSVSLRFADGSRALLGPDSRLRLDRLARKAGSADDKSLVETQLRLESGSAESKVPQRRPAARFEIRTPAVNLGVRGTDFRGRVAGQTTWLEVVEGRVEAGAQPVAAGFGTVATPQGVAAPQPLLRAPDLTGLPVQVERLPLKLSWPAVAGAQRYRAQIFAAGTEPAPQSPAATSAEPPPSQQLLLESMSDQPTASWVDDLPGGRYTLRVRSIDANGLEGPGASHDFNLDVRPQPPFLLRSTAGSQLEAEIVVLAWSRNPQAARYRLQVSQQPDFSSLVVERADLTDTEASTALPVGTYYWRVASVRADGKQGPFSDALGFERITPPPPAPSLKPVRSSDAGIVLSWSATGLTGARYQVQVARDAAFSHIVLDETVMGTEQLLAAPAPGLHHLRVRTIGANGRSGGFGSAQTIDVPHNAWWLWLLPLLLLF